MFCVGPIFKAHRARELLPSRTSPHGLFPCPPETRGPPTCASPSPATTSPPATTTTMRATTAAVGIVSLSWPRVLHGNTRATVVSFPPRSPPTTLLSVSSALAPAPAPPAANPKYHNAKVDAGGEDVDGEELLQWFRREVARAGVMEEIRRRRRHEDARDKRKRKARSASRRFRRRHFKGPYPFDEEQETKEGIMDDDKHDNWELPGGEFPSYR